MESRIKKITITIFCTLMLANSLVICLKLDTQVVVSFENSAVQPMKIVYLPYTTIEVFSNEELLSLGFIGNGTETNPIVIDNLLFDNSIYGSYAMFVNISLNVVVQNCKLEGRRNLIQVTNCSQSNFTFLGNILVEPSIGITINQCNSVTIINNTFSSDCYGGVYIEDVKSCNISNNTIEECISNTGVRIQEVDYVTVDNNIINCRILLSHLRNSS